MEDEDLELPPDLMRLPALWVDSCSMFCKGEGVSLYCLCTCVCGGGGGRGVGSVLRYFF